MTQICKLRYIYNIGMQIISFAYEILYKKSWTLDSMYNGYTVMLGYNYNLAI